LVDLASKESRSEDLKREERILRERTNNFRASDRISRDAAHEREARLPP